MKKNVIYVDFIFTHKKISYVNFHILYLLSQLKNSVNILLSYYNKSVVEKIKKAQ